MPGSSASGPNIAAATLIAPTAPASATSATSVTVTETDALVIGAGPVGLFQVFQLGLLGIGAHVVDALPHIGGQCAELYPDKPIYDIPALPHCTGLELTERLQAQIAPFTTPFHLGQEVASLQPQDDGRFLLETSAGRRFLARTVFIAAGVGAFVPRALKVEGLERFRGRQLFYRAEPGATYAGQAVVVNGGDDAALAQAIALAESTDPAARPASVTLVHRRDGFQAAPERVAPLRALVAAGRMQLVIGQITGIATLDSDEDGGSGADAARLSAVEVTEPSGSVRPLPVDTLLALLGLSPRLGPLADWGLAMERRQLPVDPATCATAVPGLYAVGDINTYPGKKKLIVCGFHESVMAAYAAAEHLQPGQRVPLQYTTTSSQLHRRLGVAPDSPPAVPQ